MTYRDRGQHGGVLPWLLVLVVLIGAIIGGAIVALWVFRNVDARLLLIDQPVQVSVIDPINVNASVLDNLEIALDQTISTRVPVDQMVTIPITDTLNMEVEFDGEVPIAMDVRVQDQITIDQVLEVDAVIDAKVLGDWHKLPIKGRIPVKAVVPVDLLIPVDQLVQLQFNAPVRARILDPLRVPLKTTIDADIPIRSQMSVPVLSDMQARVTFPPDPMDMVINYADLRLPLRTLAIELVGDGQGPRRRDPGENSGSGASTNGVTP